MKAEISYEEQMRRVSAVLTAFPDKVQEIYKVAIKAGQKAADKETAASITRTYAITRANLNDKNSTRKRMKFVADRGIMTGEINYGGYKLPLYRFSVSPRIPRRDPNDRVKVRIDDHWVTLGRSAPVTAKQLVGGSAEKWEHGFIAQMKSGHIGVFSQNKSGTAIEEKMGSSVAQMIGNTVVLDRLEMKSYEAAAAKADSQIQRILAGG
jgi:hypothetical protein